MYWQCNSLPQLLEECRKLGGIPTGIAKITPGFNLPCKYVIHVTGPRAPQSGLVKEFNFEMLGKSYIACLELFVKLLFVVFQLVFLAFQKKQSAQVALQTIKTWISKKKALSQELFLMFLVTKNKSFTRLGFRKMEWRITLNQFVLCHALLVPLIIKHFDVFPTFFASSLNNSTNNNLRAFHKTSVNFVAMYTLFKHCKFFVLHHLLNSFLVILLIVIKVVLLSKILHIHLCYTKLKCVRGPESTTVF